MTFLIALETITPVALCDAFYLSKKYITEPHNGARFFGVSFKAFLFRESREHTLSCILLHFMVAVYFDVVSNTKLIVI